MGHQERARQHRDVFVGYVPWRWYFGGSFGAVPGATDVVIEVEPTPQADYSTGETTPRAPDFSKKRVTMTPSPALSSRVSSESLTRSPPAWSRTRLVPGTCSRVSGLPLWLRICARLAIGVSTRTRTSSNMP